MKKKIFALVCLLTMIFSTASVAIIPASAADGDWIARNPVENADYSFVVLGDIQNTTYAAAKNGSMNLDKMFTWILNNRATRNIQYVFGLGDSVESMTTRSDSDAVRNPKEWDAVFSQFRRLDGKIPYGVVRGNHDDEAGYHEHICTSAYQTQMDEFFFDSSKPVTLGNSMSNSYQKIQIGNHKYLMLNLDFRATPDVIAWANDVIYTNYDHKVIISLHAYLTSSGQFYKGDIGSSNVDDTELEWVAFDGENLWNNLFSQHENVLMVLCGHIAVTDPVVQTRTGKEGNKVIEILVDPQGYEASDPCGTLMMLNFTEGGQKIEIEYYSPSKGMYFKEKNQKTLTLDAGTLPMYVASSPIVEPEETTPPPTTETTVGSEEETTEVLSESSVEKEENKNEAPLWLPWVGGGVVAAAGISFLIIRKSRKKE